MLITSTSSSLVLVLCIIIAIITIRCSRGCTQRQANNPVVVVVDDKKKEKDRNVRNLDESARNKSATDESDESDEQRNNAFFSDMINDIQKCADADIHKETLENRSSQSKKPAFQLKR